MTVTEAKVWADICVHIWVSFMADLVSDLWKIRKQCIWPHVPTTKTVAPCRLDCKLQSAHEVCIHSSWTSVTKWDLFWSTWSLTQNHGSKDFILELESLFQFCFVFVQPFLFWDSSWARFLLVQWTYFFGVTISTSCSWIRKQFWGLLMALKYTFTSVL